VADSTLRKDAPVALYCRSGKRSKKAAAILSKKGYTVYELDKGFTGWKQAGKETEK
jgi:rhodanese-related sulfurtransferase